MNRKKIAQRRHAAKRAAQRFGFSYNRHDRRIIIALIADGQAEFVQRQSNRLTVHDLVYKECFVRVVYDWKRKEIVTFLDPSGERN